jgi:hypothetical protein
MSKGPTLIMVHAGSDFGSVHKTLLIFRFQAKPGITMEKLILII